MFKMGCLSNHISNAVLLPVDESVRYWTEQLKKRLDLSLLIETVLTTLAAILIIKTLLGSFLAEAAWLVVPIILVAAAIFPKAFKRKKITKLDFNVKQIRNLAAVLVGAAKAKIDSLVVLGWTCMLVFPAAFFGCWLLKLYGLSLPLRPVLSQGQNWFCWILYQFMYVAVAEEVFFRWFLQGNILMLTNPPTKEQQTLQSWISIVISAACFAAAHIIVSGQIIAALTFLPGMILGWLFIRTRSLLAPILFHGLANICYFFMAAAIP